LVDRLVTLSSYHLGSKQNSKVGGNGDGFVPLFSVIFGMERVLHPLNVQAKVELRVGTVL
jgi:hypothetical protein